MSRQQLNYDKNLRAAIVFLNMFKLGVFEKFIPEVGATLPIVDEKNQEVGSISFFEDTININAMSDIGLIKANFKPVYAEVGKDIEALGNPRYGHWNTDIRYEIDKNSSEKLIGLCSINASIDDEFGTSVLTRHSMQCLVNDKPVMYLKMQFNGFVFSLTLINNDLEEVIDISPFALSGSFMRHVIRKGKYVSDVGYLYQYFTSILTCGNSPTMIIVRKEEESGTTLDFKREEVNKDGYNSLNGRCGRMIIPQLGTLMKEYDPNMFTKINDIREFLSCGDVSLLDSFISTSLSSYTDAEIEALFGIKREPLKYRGRIRELKDLYFGSSESFKFLE